mmetsp:Transcript_7266/g.10940  ORF Transcript_7266/g.10940 Transcript_7266/m.10940 type:complete len:243 (-) Transcript_7266:1016-1744(-)
MALFVRRSLSVLSISASISPFSLGKKTSPLLNLLFKVGSAYDIGCLTDLRFSRDEEDPLAIASSFLISSEIERLLLCVTDLGAGLTCFALRCCKRFRTSAGLCSSPSALASSIGVSWSLSTRPILGFPPCAPFRTFRIGLSTFFLTALLSSCRFGVSNFSTVDPKAESGNKVSASSIGASISSSGTVPSGQTSLPWLLCGVLLLVSIPSIEGSMKNESEKSSAKGLPLEGDGLSAKEVGNSV